MFYFSCRIQAQKALNVFHSAMTKFQHAVDWFQDKFQKVPGPMQASRPGTSLVCAAMSTGRHLNAGCPYRCLPFLAWRSLARQSFRDIGGQQERREHIRHSSFDM